MNARAHSIRPSMGQAEHISLAAEPETGSRSHPRDHSRVLETFSLTSSFRGLHTELSLLEDYFLQVISRRPGARPQRYIIDLRFVSPRPVRARSIAWLWGVDAGALLVLAALEFSRGMTAATGFFDAPAWFIFTGSAIAAIISMAWCWRSTVESLSFVSVHGQTSWVQIVGGIGSAKAGKKFFVQLIRAINAAKESAPAERRQYLRDEMREHHRLHELGILSDTQYQASKARILTAHS